MTQARMLKAKRLLELHHNMQQLEEHRIARLNIRQTELSAEQERVLQSLDDDHGLQGLFIASIIRRLKTLGEESQRLTEEIARRTRSLRTLAARTKHAERISQSYEQLHARAVSEKELRDIIERLARPSNASLP